MIHPHSAPPTPWVTRFVDPARRRWERTSSRARIGLLAVLLGWVSWPIGDVTPCDSADCSWQLGLHAQVRGYWHGSPATVFTYGPLGFLTAPQLWTRATAALSLIAGAVVQVALCWLLLRRVRLLLPAWPAALVTVVLARAVASNNAEIAIIVVALACTELISSTPGPRARAVAAAIAGLLLLDKFSLGLLATFATIVVAIAQRDVAWRRRARDAIAGAATSVAASFVGYLLLTLQPLTFVTWFRASMNVASGYYAAALEVPGRADEYGLALVVTALLIAVAWLVRNEAGTRWSILVILVAAWLKFREGFERHDQHSILFFSAMVVLPLGLPIVRRARAPVLVATAASFVILCNISGVAPATMFSFYSSPRALISQTNDILDSGRARRIQTEAQAQARKDYAVAPDLVELLRGHRVQVDPVDAAVTWAYGLSWRPTFSWTSYVAYSPFVDDQNAASLLKSSGPDRILRSIDHAGFDDHYPVFESPRYQLTELCGYRLLGQDAHWQVLGRSTDQCGTTTHVSTVHARPGAHITVPQVAGAIVYAKIHLSRPLTDRLLTALFKPPHYTYIEVDGRRWRLLPKIATQPLVLAAAAWAPPGPAAPTSLDVRDIAVWGETSDVTVDFYAIARAGATG